MWMVAVNQIGTGWSWAWSLLLRLLLPLWLVTTTTTTSSVSVAVAVAVADGVDINIDVDMVDETIPDYVYYCTGNCDKPVTTTTHPGLILMGGGTDVDAAFIQQIEWSGCGDFLVLRSDRDDKYDRYVYNLGCANSASTIWVRNRNGANNPNVTAYIYGAEAIFFAGGDQATYLQDWEGTALQTAVQAQVAKGVPIGGTSAGCDIQSNYIYSATNGSVNSPEALADPYNRFMTFAGYFLIQGDNNILNNTIIDTHFVTRDRFGRLVAFVARVRTDDDLGHGRPIKGIGINEQTAFAIDLETGLAEVLGPVETSEAYLLMPDHDPEVCEPSTPLTYKNINVQKVKPGDVFNFKTWTGGESNRNYDVSYINGIPQEDPYKTSN